MATTDLFGPMEMFLKLGFSDSYRVLFCKFTKDELEGVRGKMKRESIKEEKKEGRY